MPKQVQLVRIPRQRSCNQRVVVCYVVWLGPIKGMGLWTSTRCVGLALVVVGMALELKYRNTPWKQNITTHH